MNGPHDNPHLFLHANLTGGVSVCLRANAEENQHDKHFMIGKPVKVASPDLDKSLDQLAAQYFPQHFKLPRPPTADEDAAPSAGVSSLDLPSVATSSGVRPSAFFDRARAN